MKISCIEGENKITKKKIKMINIQLTEDNLLFLKRGISSTIDMKNIDPVFQDHFLIISHEPKEKKENDQDQKV